MADDQPNPDSWRRPVQKHGEREKPTPPPPTPPSPR